MGGGGGLVSVFLRDHGRLVHTRVMGGITSERFISGLFFSSFTEKEIPEGFGYEI